MRYLLHLLLIAVCWLGIVVLVPAPRTFANHDSTKRTQFRSAQAQPSSGRGAAVVVDGPGKSLL